MKTTMYVWAILSFLSGALQAQSSGMEGKRWHVLESWGWDGGSSTIVYKTEGLLEYNGQVYSKVWVAYGSQLENWYGSSRLIRQDSLGSIYVVNSVHTYDTFSYHFNRNLGDVVSTDLEGCAAEVVGIDSVEMLDGTLRKRLELKHLNYIFGPYSAYWYEGIGSTYGIMDPLYCIIDVDVTLICYFEDDEKLYEKYPNSGDCLFTIINTEEAASPPLSRVHPNPSAGLVYLDTEHSLDQLQLWSAQGQHLQTLSGDVREIDLSGYPAGVYFLRLHTREGVVEVVRVVRG